MERALCMILMLGGFILALSPVFSAEPIRIYIMQSDSWEVRGATAGGANW